MAAQTCTGVRSSWVAMAILMCDNTLSVLFKNGVCCNYRGTTAAWYHRLVGAASKGRWVRQNLYKKMPYRIIRLPCPPAGCGQTTSCCPGTTVPNTLHATLSDNIGCACVSGTIALTFNAGTSQWTGTGAFGTCGHTLSIALACTTIGPQSFWQVTVSYPDGCEVGSFTFNANAGGTCSPFQQVFSIPLSGVCGCASNAGYTITVTT